MKTTRRTSGRGLKIRARRNRSRSSGSPASSSTGRSLMSCHRRVPLSWTIILVSRPPMLWPTMTIRSNAASEPIGVELPPHLVQVAPQQRGRIGDRVARRVAEGPELIAVAEGRIGLQALDHPGPRPRVRPQPVDEDHRDLAALVGPEEGEARRLEPEEPRDVRIRPRRRAAGRLAR